MNQILSVNNNNNDNNYSNETRYNMGNGGKKVEIKVVVVFFCIVLIAFGGFIIANGIHSISSESEIAKGNQTGEALEKAENYPDISIQVVSDTERNLIISHNKVITSIKYYWNDEEATVINGNGKNNFEIKNIEVPPGTNMLNVVVTDEDDKEKTYSKEQTSEERPCIKMTKEDNAIKIVVESKTANIDYISYYWDNDEPKKYTINDKKTQSTLEVKDEDLHTLTMIAVDTNGKEATKVQKIKGLKAPSVKITTDGQNFILRASDENEIDKIVVNLNGNETEKTINQKQYEGKIKALDGENRLIVTVYNKDGIKKQSKIKWTKE